MTHDLQSDFGTCDCNGGGGYHAHSASCASNRPAGQTRGEQLAFIAGEKAATDRIVARMEVLGDATLLDSDGRIYLLRYDDVMNVAKGRKRSPNMPEHTFKPEDVDLTEYACCAHSRGLRIPCPECPDWTRVLPNGEELLQHVARVERERVAGWLDKGEWPKDLPDELATVGAAHALEVAGEAILKGEHHA